MSLVKNNLYQELRKELGDDLPMIDDMIYLIFDFGNFSNDLLFDKNMSCEYLYKICLKLEETNYIRLSKFSILKNMLTGEYIENTDNLEHKIRDGDTIYIHSFHS